MNQTILHAAAVITGPLILLAFGLVPDRVSNPKGRRFAALASHASLVVVGLAVLALIGRIVAGPLALAGPFGISLYFDSLSAIMLLLGSIFTMALAYMLWNLWSSSHRTSLIFGGLLIASATATAYFTLHAVFEKMLAGSLPAYDPHRTPAEYFVMALVGLAFMAVLILQSQLPTWSATRTGRAIYVHASHGFYLGTIFNRLTLAVSGKSSS